MRTGCAPAAAAVPICGRSSMATRQGWLRRAPARVTRLVTANGEAIARAVRFVSSHGVAFSHWLKRSSTGAVRLGTSALEALVSWVKRINTDVVIVIAETEVENLGTEQIPINLPKIDTKHDLVVFDYIGEF